MSFNVFLSLTCLLMVAVMAHAQQYTYTHLEEPKASSWRVTLTVSKEDTEFIPIGKAKPTETISAELEMHGWNLGHGVRFEVTSDWMSAKGYAGQATAYFEDHKGAGYDASRYLDIVYRCDSRSFVYYYLRIQPEYIEGCGEGTACNSKDHSITFTAKGGTSFISASERDGRDANIATTSGDYVAAAMIPLALTSYPINTRLRLTTTKMDAEYFPIGLGSVTEVISLNLGVGGYGTSHGMKIDIVGDYLCDQEGGRGTVYIMDNKKDGEKDHTQYLSLMYKSPGRSDGGCGKYWWYLKIDAKYTSCSDGNTACEKSQHDVTMMINNAGRSFLPGDAEGGFDPDFDEDDYATATKVELAKLQANVGTHVTTLTTRKDDVEYVSLGLASMEQPLELAMGFEGWGTSHGFKIQVVSDWFDKARQTDKYNDMSAYIQGPLSKGGARTANWKVLYSKHPTLPRLFYVYLEFATEHVQCPADPPYKDECEAADHTVSIYSVQSGNGYVGGTRGVDPDFDVTNYSEAKKVDLSDVTKVAALVQSTATNAAAVIAMEEKLNAAVLSAEKNAADVSALQAKLDSSTDAHAALAAKFAALEAKLDTFLQGPADSVASKQGGNADGVPTIGANGADLTLGAGGSDGRVLLDSLGCPNRDLCKIAHMVDAIAAKFDN